MKNLRHRRFWDRGLVLLTAAGLVIGCGALCIFPAPRFSTTENRYLAELPTLTASEVLNGNYAAALDAYATERFPSRTVLRQARALLQLMEGRCEVGGVLLCKDGSLAKRMTVNEGAFAQNLEGLQRLIAPTEGADLPITVAIVPRRIDARTAVLPSLYCTKENNAVWERLRSVLPQALTFPDLTADAHWYRTDHHWTTEGAFAAYEALARQWGIPPYGRGSFHVEVVSKRFFGTSHATAGIPLLQADEIALYRYVGDEDMTLLLDGKLAPFGGFYDFDKLRTRDGYGVFFGGNYGVLELTDHTERETLLVIKDSFANSLLPFLARHFNIIAVDPRYTSAPFSSFADRADRILVLCGMQTLCETTVLRALTKK